MIRVGDAMAVKLVAWLTLQEFVRGSDAAYICRYDRCAMHVSVAEARSRLSELLRSVENGENVVITRNGRPVAQLVPASSRKRAVRFGTMRGRIHLKPGWDDPIETEQFLAGEF
jgi:prevent-host-death family protein